MHEAGEGEIRMERQDEAFSGTLFSTKKMFSFPQMLGKYKRQCHPLLNSLLGGKMPRAGKSKRELNNKTIKGAMAWLELSKSGMIMSSHITQSMQVEATVIKVAVQRGFLYQANSWISKSPLSTVVLGFDEQQPTAPLARHREGMLQALGMTLVDGNGNWLGRNEDLLLSPQESSATQSPPGLEVQASLPVVSDS